MKQLHVMDKYCLNYEKEATKKCVSKLLHKLDTQGDSTVGKISHLAKQKIIDFFGEAEEIFAYYDVARAGEISINMFPKMARALKQVYDAREIKQFEKEMKIKKIYKMNLPMFLALLKRKLFEEPPNDTLFAKSFEILDLRKEDNLNLKTLRKQLSLVGDTIEEKSFDDFIKYYIEHKKNGESNEFLFNNNNEPTHLKKDGFLNLLTHFEKL